MIRESTSSLLLAHWTLNCDLLGESQRTQNPHLTAQTWRHDVPVHLLEYCRDLDVPIEQGLYFSLNPREQLALVHDA